MPRYTQDYLITLAEALYRKGFIALANSVRWWNSERYIRKNSPHRSRLENIMRSPLKEMPLYISDESESIKIIATERLKLRR